MKLIAQTFFFILMFTMLTCKFSSVDYAVGDVQLISKTRTTVEGKPAIRLQIENTGDDDVHNVRITIKAKKSQRDLQVETVFLERLSARERIIKRVVFDQLGGHSDYDLLTYAINFSQ
ncbi:MAG: hypothetical protein ACE5IY_16585 [bacterium]